MADELNLGPAVENGRLRYLSVSSVGTASDDQDGGCLRKWWFDKVAGLPRPATKNQELGTLVHAEIEHYLRTGEDVLGAIARPGKHFLPEPKSVGLYVEHPIGIGGRDALGRVDFRPDLTAELDTGLHVPFVGFIDVVNATGRWVDDAGEAHVGGPVEAIDWKTSKAPDRYAKAGSALARTIQMVGYARYLMQARGVDEVRVSHVTFATEGKKHARKSTAVLTRLTVEGRWYNVQRTASDMARAARESDPQRVAANYSACGAYGGCPFRDACPRDAKTALRDALGASGEKFMGVLDDVMGRQDDQPEKEFSGKVPGQDAMPKGMSVAARKAWLRLEQEAQLAELEAEEKAEAEKAALSKTFPAKAEAEKAAADKEKAAPPTETGAKPTTGGLRAKDARQNETYLVCDDDGEYVPMTYICRTRGGLSFSRGDGKGAPAILDDNEIIYPCGVIAPDAPKAGESGPVAESIHPDDVVPDVVRRAADEVAPHAPPPEKEKKTRKPRAKKGEAPPEVAPLTSTLPVREPPPVDEPPPAPLDIPLEPDERVGLTPEGAAEAPTDAGAGGFTLLVDCVPTYGAVRHRNLAEVVETVHQAMRQTFKCDDMRCANDERLAFGRWKGAFAAGLRHYHERTPLAGYVVAEARGSELVALAVEALAPLADGVIRGL